MAFTIKSKGTATLTSTRVAAITSTKEGQSYVDVSGVAASSFVAASSSIVIGVRQAVRDVVGNIGIEWTRTADTSARFYSTRPIPSGEELIFDWMSIHGS